MRLTVANREAVRYACLKFHYARSVPVNTLGYNVFNNDDEWCGVVLFGWGANRHIAGEYGLVQGECMELVRVALNGKQEMTSQCVAAALKALKKDCPLCQLVVSYADCDQNHLGTIYQAGNWIYVGTVKENKKDCSWMIKGKRWHGRTVSDLIKSKGGLKGLSREQFLRKFFDSDAYEYVTKGKRKYLMSMNKNMRKRILPLAKPYPKEDSWVKIDRAALKK